MLDKLLLKRKDVKRTTKTEKEAEKSASFQLLLKKMSLFALHHFIHHFMSSLGILDLFSYKYMNEATEEEKDTTVFFSFLFMKCTFALEHER